MNKQQCETCRFWKTWDEAEPVKITKREFWFRQFKDMYSTEQVEALMQQLPDDMESLIFNPECTGDCRVHAPEIAVNRAADDDSDPCIGRWPFTSVDDWCGEWQPKSVGSLAEPIDACHLLNQLDPAQISSRLSELEDERLALMTLLRAARKRKDGTWKTAVKCERESRNAIDDQKAQA
jgi:hypothetical protein